MDSSLPRQEYWGGLPLLSAGDLPDPGIKLPSLRSTALVGKFFITSNTWEAQYIICVCTSESEAAQLCPTLCDPVDYSPPGSSIHGILQAKILEWVAISLLACEMSAIVWEFEHSLALPFFGIGMKTDLFQSCGHC